ncbi:FeoB-associated Cys-rich membrane protein [Paludibacterium purpuratum]|uniref:Attachment p12 family protein n=1 Tax=Paludibacterium purpuratum TaxID=1144873 RepID=A0A4R7BCR8_9NEIS|nr:FeoB-associated Cys-rich membrane protein [Paludibacterium purpuratum]TDR82870.1 attachment p12 family protein [Paludibacterium purpuratum]
MNNGLWIQYAIIGALVVVSLVYVARKLRASVKNGDCAGSCGHCGGCGDDSEEPAKAVVVAVHPRKPER